MTFLSIRDLPTGSLSKQVKLEVSNGDGREEVRKSEGLLKVKTTTKGGSVVALLSQYT